MSPILFSFIYIFEFVNTMFIKIMKNKENELNLNIKHLNNNNKFVFDFNHIIFYILTFTAICCFILSYFISNNIRAKLGWLFYGIILIYESYILYF